MFTSRKVVHLNNFRTAKREKTKRSWMLMCKKEIQKDLWSREVREEGKMQSCRHFFGKLGIVIKIKQERIS